MGVLREARNGSHMHISQKTTQDQCSRNRLPWAVLLFTQISKLRYVLLFLFTLEKGTDQTVWLLRATLDLEKPSRMVTYKITTGLS